MPSNLSPFAPLRHLRIGCVRYLNARPLIEPYTQPECSGLSLDLGGGDSTPTPAPTPDNVCFDHPASLAAALVAGELDVALVPVFEALRSPGFPIVDGVTISATGPVWSVFVAHKEENPEAIESIALDPASLTSANLCRVLFAERQERQPRFIANTANAQDAQLIIGNQAIEFREAHGENGAYRYLDLAEEWQRLHNGLPFVFAVWLMRPELAEPGNIADAFRAIAAQGLAQVGSIAASHSRPYAPGFAHRYLTEHIQFGMGPREKEAMALFRQLLVKHDRLPPSLLHGQNEALLFV